MDHSPKAFCIRENDTTKDSFSAFLVKDAQFTSMEEYPVLTPKMIAKKLPKKIMPFDKALHYRGDLTDTFVCTFAPDSTFERVRKNPAKYIPFLKRTAGLIGFDFSVHSDMPIIKQKSQINDNLSLTYYYGKQGIPIIPNLRCGVDELIPEFFEAIPKHSKIAIGTHGFIKEKHQKYEWFYFVERVIDKLQPTDIIVYGTLSDKMFDELKQRTNIVIYNSWMTDRWKEVLTHGN